jgi:hypothetical protein
MDSRDFCWNVIESVDHICDDQEVLHVVRGHRWRRGGSHHYSFRWHAGLCWECRIGGKRMI